MTFSASFDAKIHVSMLQASGHYLTELFPDDWDTKSRSDMITFISEHLLEDQEYRDPEAVLEDIEETAIMLSEVGDD